MKNRRIYIAGIILAMFVASVGTSACGNKGNAGSGQKQTSEQKQITNESKEDKKTGSTGDSNKTENNTGSTNSATSTIASNTTSNTGSTTSTASNSEAKGDASEELDYANMTEDDLVKDLIDKESLTEEEVLWLDSTFRYVEFDKFLNLPSCISYKAFDLLNDKGVKYEFSEKNIETLLKSKYPQLRVRAMEHMFSFFGLSDEHKEMVKELVKTETEPAVIKEAIAILGNSGNDPEVGAFLIASAKHEDPRIRETAASWIGSYWNDKMEGAVEAELELMKDEDIKVADAAYRNCNNMTDKRILEALKEALNDDEKYELHGSCMDSVIYMWLNYPSHEKYNKEAYKISMDYYKKKPRTKDVPYWIAVSHLDKVNEDKFDAWKKKAKYYKPKEIVEVMTDIVKDKNADYLARCCAIDVIAKHGGKKAFKDLKPIIKKLKDEKADSIRDAYKSKEEKFK